MRHDPLDLNYDMTRGEIFWRVVFITSVSAIILLDLLVWRPN